MTKTNYMKTKGLFLSALMMGAVLAGCSSDNDVMNNEENKSAAKGDSYIAVNIVNPGVGSRAADDAVGTDEENEVKSALMYSLMTMAVLFRQKVLMYLNSVGMMVVKAPLLRFLML